LLLLYTPVGTDLLQGVLTVQDNTTKKEKRNTSVQLQVFEHATLEFEAFNSDPCDAEKSLVIIFMPV
jgi:hypothetical protein